MTNLKYYFLFTFSVLFFEKSFSQYRAFDLRSPLDIPLYLSGNFGELRSNHFHTGIDIKTQGVTGKNVYAVADGYVSRIKIQKNGYGNALYLKHPNGYTTVYGHLDSFRDDIKKYIAHKQYSNREFEIDLYFDQSEFKVKKGDLIAYSGNSGGSSGPHLHFEIRDANQHPLNVLHFPLDIKDDVAPVFRSLYIYPLNEGEVNYDKQKTIYSTTLNNGTYSIDGGTIKVCGEIGIGLEVYDYMNSTNNRYGVYTMELTLNNELKYRFVMDELNFSTNRYINSHIDYEEKQENRKNVHKLFKLPNNKLDLYSFAANDGIFNITDTALYKFSITATDVNKNVAVLHFNLKGYEKAESFPIANEKKDIRKMIFSEYNTFNRNDIRITIPEGALYDDLDFQYYKEDMTDSRFFSSVHQVQSRGIPLHKYMSIAIKPDSVIKDRIKMCIALLDNGQMEYVDSKWKNDFIEGSTRSFGKFVIACDTISPQILALNFKNGDNLSAKSKIDLLIKDEFSGINNYTCYIDDKWALFMYDQKNDIMSHEFDGNRFKQNTWHTLKVIVKDNVYNTTERDFKFFW